MNRFLILGFAAVGVLSLSAKASATFIDFEDGTDFSPVGSNYSAQGVTFTNATWISTGSLPGSSGDHAIFSSASGYQPVQSSPIGASFSSDVSSVTLRGIDVGANGFRMKAFDSSNALVDDQVVFGTDLGIGEFFDLTVNGSISRIEFSLDHNSSNDGVLWDNMSFSPVPEPASMIALGAGALALLRRRRK